MDGEDMVAPPPDPDQLALRTETIKFRTALLAFVIAVIGALSTVLPARHAASTAQSHADTSQAQVQALAQQSRALKSQLGQAQATIAALQSASSAPSPSTGAPANLAGATYLADMDVVYGRYRQFVTADDLTFVGFKTGVLESDGQSFDHSVYHGDLDPDQPAYIDYNLGKKYSKLIFTGAIADAAPETSKVRFEVSLDGHLSKQLEVKFGSPQKISVNVSGALRLRLYFLRLDNSDTHYDAGAADATLTP